MGNFLTRKNFKNYCEEIGITLEELYESLLKGNEHTIDLCKGKGKGKN